MKMGVQELAEISRDYGANTDYVVAGGGNTSFKDDKNLWIKGSGTALAVITPEAFVKMDRQKLAQIWTKNYPAGEKQRESEVLADMMAAKAPGEESKRPSVETQLHDLLPFKYVVHTHPSLVNGLTCSKEADGAAKKIFGSDQIWIPSIKPGYVLAKAVKESLEAGGKGQLIFLQNHGVFVAADTPEEIKTIYKKIMTALDTCIKRRPDFSDKKTEYKNSAEASAILAKVAEGGAAYSVIFERNNEIGGFVESRTAFTAVASAFTPDHIVYSGSDPLFISALDNGRAAAELSGAALEALITDAWKKHKEKTGRIPKIAALEGVGVFGIGVSEKTAALALELFGDTMKVACYAEAFGGGLFMERDKIDFINTWEVEQYRSQVSVSAIG
jgi:rhamnose utilization protein RhaD (predicted bifunctional aldolase and dehydrogenase)